MLQTKTESKEKKAVYGEGDGALLGDFEAEGWIDSDGCIEADG